MVLVEQGRLRLQDRVAQYLPEFGQKGKEAINGRRSAACIRAGLIPDNPLAIDTWTVSEKRLAAQCVPWNSRSEPGSEFIY